MKNFRKFAHMNSYSCWELIQKVNLRIPIINQWWSQRKFITEKNHEQVHCSGCIFLRFLNLLNLLDKHANLIWLGSFNFHFKNECLSVLIVIFLLQESKVFNAWGLSNFRSDLLCVTSLRLLIFKSALAWVSRSKTLLPHLMSLRSIGFYLLKHFFSLMRPLFLISCNELSIHYSVSPSQLRRLWAMVVSNLNIIWCRPIELAFSLVFQIRSTQ